MPVPPTPGSAARSIRHSDFIAGWALLSLSTIFMVAAALPAGEATLDLVAPGQLHNVPLGDGDRHPLVPGRAGARDLRYHRDRQSAGRADVARSGRRDPRRRTCDLALARGTRSRLFLGLVLPIPFRHLRFLLSRDAGRDLLFFRLGRVVQSRGRDSECQDTRPASAASLACS